MQSRCFSHTRNRIFVDVSLNVYTVFTNSIGLISNETLSSCDDCSLVRKTMRNCSCDNSTFCMGCTSKRPKRMHVAGNAIDTSSSSLKPIQTHFKKYHGIESQPQIAKIEGFSFVLPKAMMCCVLRKCDELKLMRLMLYGLTMLY